MSCCICDRTSAVQLAVANDPCASKAPSGIPKHTQHNNNINKVNKRTDQGNGDGVLRTGEPLQTVDILCEYAPKNAVLVQQGQKMVRWCRLHERIQQINNKQADRRNVKMTKDERSDVNNNRKS